jgi:hypothetical protein
MVGRGGLFDQISHFLLYDLLFYRRYDTARDPAHPCLQEDLKSATLELEKR